MHNNHYGTRYSIFIQPFSHSLLSKNECNISNEHGQNEQIAFLKDDFLNLKTYLNTLLLFSV